MLLAPVTLDLKKPFKLINVKHPSVRIITPIHNTYGPNGDSSGPSLSLAAPLGVMQFKVIAGHT